MGIFDLFKTPKLKQQETQEEQTLEEYLSELRAKRMAERFPETKRGVIPNAPEGFNHFNLNDVLVGMVNGEYHYYLFAGDNLKILKDDLSYLNSFAQEANNLVKGVPYFAIDPFEVACDPFPDYQRQSWLFSRIIIEDKTPTGKLKKYPVKALIQTLNGEKTGSLYYTLDGRIGKGGIIVHLNPNTKDFIAYGFDFIADKISYVWESKETGKIMLYNKNNGSM